jgi:UrcA family protein
MTKGRIALLGSAMAVLLAGAAHAQGHYADGYTPPPGYYDDRGGPSETVIVHPNDYIDEQQLTGRFNGEINPQAYSISRPVDFSDLDLRRVADREALHDRIFQTASDMCAELDARVPGLSGSPSEDRECVQDATRNAMRDVMDRVYG